MTYKELGFRPLYHSFVGIMLTDDLKDVLRDFPGADEANCAVAYGYIDHEAGFTFEVLEAAVCGDGQIDGALDGTDEVRSFIRAEAVADCELINLNGNAEMIEAIHSDKLQLIDENYQTEALEETRLLDYLDERRDPVYVDDIAVMIEKDGLKTEICWARLEEVTDSELKGILLNEPNQDFGCHEGDLININIFKAEDNRIYCYSDWS